MIALIQMNIQNSNRLRHRKQTYGYQRGRVWGVGEGLGVWDGPMHPAVYGKPGQWDLLCSTGKSTHYSAII